MMRVPGRVSSPTLPFPPGRSGRPLCALYIIGRDPINDVGKQVVQITREEALEDNGAQRYLVDLPPLLHASSPG